MLERTRPVPIQLPPCSSTTEEPNEDRRASLDASGAARVNSLASELLPGPNMPERDLQNVVVHLDGYDIMQEVGRGAFGVVNKVVERSTGRELARKLISLKRRKEEENQKTVARIKQELLILSDCKCDNIVAFHGAYYDDKYLSIFMELMDMSVHDMLLSVRLFPEKHLSWIAVNTLNAVRYLKSEKRVLHRDLKPANILVNAAGEIKLCDLGICATLSKQPMSTPSSWVGTQTYMSPERFDGNGSTVSSEVWSLGMILIEAAIGYPIPHPEKSEISVIQKKISLLERGEWKELVLLEQKWLRVTCNRVAAIELRAQLSPPPELPAGIFSDEFRDFTSKCLVETPSERSSVDELLSHAFVQTTLSRRAESQESFKAFVHVSSERPIANADIKPKTSSILSVLFDMFASVDSFNILHG